MVTDKELAELIFPEIKESLSDLENRYPERKLPEGAEVTRFAPSPTGFLHTGSLFTSMICHKVAHQSKGIFYVRLEDTDTKREIEGSGLQLLEQLKVFDVYPDEGYMGDHESGNYGPYQQSKRADIYKVAIKWLMENGRAYPDFATPEELDEIRKEQEKNKLLPGYYGEFAKYRHISNDERVERIKKGEPYVIRFKSLGNHDNKIQVSDVIRGDFEIMENDQDIVIMKSDGLPTYHFAHCIDDHFMRTTTVIRGAEWIASLPIHVDLFKAMGWKAPKYAHLPVIMKLDENGNRRKLSKRLDNEAAVSYFLEDGYPTEALIMYLMTIANSNFERWILDNKFEGMDDFTLSFDKMSLDGALFDMGKLNFFSRELLGKKNKEEFYLMAKQYGKEYNKELYDLIESDPDYFKAIINIEREKENPRKDYEKMADVLPIISFFYPNYYEGILKQGFSFNEKFTKEDIKAVLEGVKALSLEQDEQSWFNQMKEIGSGLGYAADRKALKANPELYKGGVSDIAEILRIALSGRKNTPNLYYVMKILTKEVCLQRIDKVIATL
ncbi:MAG: glutamate--tRNA ligase [Erysipelotrichaceae bacterium]|nr:glutamate--tRNA ligase [Erysipelotrichaceae bacterium]